MTHIVSPWRLSTRFVLAAALLLPVVVSIRAGQTGPKISATEPQHDFGTVPQGQAVRHEFAISNVGDQALEISDVRPTCGCTTTGDWPHTLKPGQSASIPVKLDTSHFVGPITKAIIVTSNDPAQPETFLQLKGTIWTPVSIANPVLIFPATGNPNDSATRATTIRNEEEGTLTLTDLTSENAHFKPSLRVVVPGKEYELTVATVPPLPEGTQNGRITMKSSNPKNPEVVVQAVVTVLPPVQVAPNEFTFGTRKLIAPEKRYAVVLNHRGYDLQVSDIATDAPGVQLTTTRGSDGKQVTVTLAFPAGFEIGPGTKYHLRGKTNHPTVPTFDIPIALAPQH